MHDAYVQCALYSVQCARSSIMLAMSRLCRPYTIWSNTESCYETSDNVLAYAYVNKFTILSNAEPAAAILCPICCVLLNNVIAFKTEKKN